MSRKKKVKTKKCIHQKFDSIPANTDYKADIVPYKKFPILNFLILFPNHEQSDCQVFNDMFSMR